MFRSTVIALFIATAGLAIEAGPVPGVDADEWLRRYSGGVNSLVYAPAYRGEGFGVKLTPTAGNYPVRLDQARFYLSGNEAGPRGRWRVRVYDDDGPGDTCGTVLLDTIIPSQVDRWNTVVVRRDIIIRNGSFYVFAYCDTWDASAQAFPRFRFDTGLDTGYVNHDSAPGSGHAFSRRVLPGGAGDPYFEAYVTGLNYDLALARIVTPVGVFDSTDFVIPACSVANTGQLSVPAYKVRFQLGDFKLFANVANHDPGTTRLVQFAPLPVFPRGPYAVTCSTELEGDAAAANDCRRDTVRVRVRDVGIAAIESPSGIVDSGTTVAPTVLVGNSGSDTSTALLWLGIGSWRDSAPVIIPPGEETGISLRDWTALQRGTNPVVCSLRLAGDVRPADNRHSTSVSVRVSDLAALRVLDPDTTNRPGVIAPRALVANLGTGRSPCTASFSINSSPAWSRSLSLPAGLPQGETTLVFPDWTAAAGRYSARCSVGQAAEQVPANDVAVLDFTVGATDVALEAIVAPAGGYDTVQPVIPLAVVRNRSDFAVAPRVWLTLADSAGALAYVESLDLAPIASLDSGLAEFPEWPLPHAVGDWTVACSVAAPFDTNPANDRLAAAFRVWSRPPLPAGWAEATPVPLEPSGRPLRDGAWLCPVGNWVYVAKGYKTGDFYRYSVERDSWQNCAALPLGEEDRPPAKGATACSDDNRYIYATKGNNTLGFWRYDTRGDSWTALAPIPVGFDRRRIKGGTDLVRVRHPRTDSEYVYLLKGGRTEFYRYNVTAGRWSAMPDAPAVDKPRWDKGSWLVYDGDRTIYAHRAKYHDLYRYDLVGDTWNRTALAGMPIESGLSGRRKKSKDGGSALWQDGVIYALKGGNSTEFYCYDPAAAAWRELDTLPSVGSTGKRKAVKGGGALCWYDGLFFAVKGAKTAEYWRYAPGTPDAGGRTQHARMGVQGVEREASGVMLLVQNPSRGTAAIRWSGPSTLAPRPSTLALYDASGRLVFTRPLRPSTSGTLDLNLPDLPAGAYLVRFDAGHDVAVGKLILQR